ncbi:hypothetical protein niasHT_021527 [Heterodera trifolii]|uniref:3'-5' exonuclease domain-containing protein n=1 Tax=Heterodera trifolii TaxID=157864 RepID=A0ABD2K127_9BILA
MHNQQLQQLKRKKDAPPTTTLCRQSTDFLGISRAEPLVDTSGGCRRNLRSLVYEACGVWLDKSLATADWTRRLNRLAHAQGLPNVFAKDSTVRPATDFFKINERHHMHLDKLVDKLEDEAATNVPMAYKTASAFFSLRLRPPRRCAGTECQTDPLPILMSLLRTKLFQVNSTVGLFRFAEKLCSVDEFAFDFELSCFVYVGHPREQCICLLQISTEDTDILVDVLVDEVRDNFRLILATVFADKRIKMWVCHGAQKRTFLGQLGISRAEPLVDTSGGCRRNLRSLVYEACGVWLDKSLATADWTPLTNQMVDYARCDTYYLLRCYHHLMKTGRL